MEGYFLFEGSFVRGRAGVVNTRKRKRRAIFQIVDRLWLERLSKRFHSFAFFLSSSSVYFLKLAYHSFSKRVVRIYKNIYGILIEKNKLC